MVQTTSEERARPACLRPAPGGAAVLLAVTVCCFSWCAASAAVRIRLDDPADREVFRQWFTFLAEDQFYRPPAALPREISDCAGLVRYAYRESLRRHDGPWAASLGLQSVLPLGSVRQWNYPFGPGKRGLFVVDDGGAMAEFADAQTLMRLNAFRIGATLDAARPGDLLFFRQTGQRLPFHVMIFLGRSHFEQGRLNYVVYHTGPDGNAPGEVRRPSVGELRGHPNPQWRPLDGNPHFLGVFRWNILGDS